MIRTNEEWYDYATRRGTNGDMVFDILDDWKEEIDRANESIHFLQKVIEDRRG